MRCVDLLEQTPHWFRAGYAWSYLYLVRHLPWIWKISYACLDHAVIFRLVQPVRRWWNARMTRRARRWIDEMDPDAIVATHFLPVDVCSAGKRAGWLRAPLVAVVTDWHPHRIWLSRWCEAVVVGTREAAAVCQRRGIDSQRLHIAGIPIAQAFGASMDQAALQRQLDLDPERLTALVTSGGTTVGQFEHVVDALMQLEAVLPQRLQLLVVCGEDEGARRRLAHRAQSSVMPLRVFGFVENMAELMAASDLIVAKAGGLTISEALARELPLVLYHVIPGQERMNARYAAQAGAAVVAPRPTDVARCVRRCVEEPAYLGQLRGAAQALGRPHAAAEIVTRVVKPLLDQSIVHSP